jgi:hypothetical protein
MLFGISFALLDSFFGDFIYSSWQALADGATPSWLRSPVAGRLAQAAYLSGTGSIQATGVEIFFRVRPALWVSADIFA